MTAQIEVDCHPEHSQLVKTLRFTTMRELARIPGGPPSPLPVLYQYKRTEIQGRRSPFRLETPMTTISAKTIPSLISEQAAHHGDRTALATPEGQKLTYADLSATINQLANELNLYGVSRTSRVAVVLPNGINQAVGLLAVTSSAIALPLAPRATTDEYNVWFRIGRITHVLTASSTASAANDVAAELGLTMVELVQADGYRIKGLLPSAHHATGSAPKPADVAVVLMTSGSTGTPKRVPLTHANLLAGAKSVANALELTPSDRVLVMWEQYHIGGLVDLLLAPLIGGGSVIYAGSFDASRFFELIGPVRPTWFQGVPTTLRELLIQATLSGNRPLQSTLRLLRSVAAPLSPELMKKLEEAFGVPVIQTFGMTEAAPLITTNHLPPGTRKPGSTGTPCDCEVAVLDQAGNRLTQGCAGEVAVRGPNVFAGYEDAPEINRRVFQGDWFRTGDVGWLDDDGFLHLTSRIKEMINRGGEKITPAEVEEAAISHPAVSQAAAFAVPHASLGEDVGLAVVPSGLGHVDRATIRSHIARQLSPFKLPAVVLVLEELPRCPIGKIRRRDLAELAVAAHSKAPSNGAERSQPEQDLLVESLITLWALHLDLPTVDPDVNFELLGGDSLSRIRLIVAVESLYSVRLPDQAAATITTVNRMATEIRRAGGVVTLQGGGAPADLWGDGNASMLADAAPFDIHHHLASCRSIHELNTIREGLLNTLALDELAEVMKPGFGRRLQAALGRVVRHVPWRSPSAEYAQVSAELAAWRREILSLSKKDRGPGWQRRRLSSNALIYRRQTQRSDRRLIVGFAGNHQRLMLPTHLILANLPPHDDLLLVADPDRRHFEAGVPGIAPSLEEVAEWINLYIDSAGYNRESVVCFGTSGGGLAAVYTAYALKCQRVGAIGIDSPGNHPQLKQCLLKQLESVPEDHQPEVILAYDPTNHRDCVGGTAVSKMIPNSQTMLLKAGGSHNSLQPIAKKGRLSGVLRSMLGEHELFLAAERSS